MKTIIVAIKLTNLSSVSSLSTMTPQFCSALVTAVISSLSISLALAISQVSWAVPESAAPRWGGTDGDLKAAGWSLILILLNIDMV